jgi:hypothetical protein
MLNVKNHMIEETVQLVVLLYNPALAKEESALIFSGRFFGGKVKCYIFHVLIAVLRNLDIIVATMNGVGFIMKEIRVCVERYMTLVMEQPVKNSQFLAHANNL